MKPELLPLLLASEHFEPDDERELLDRLRMQKGVFLLQMRGPSSWEVFKFRPWDWGPYSRDLASTVDELELGGLLETEDVDMRRFSRYKTTSKGESRVEQFVPRLSEPRAELIQKVRRYVTSRSFSQLLKEIYARYPDYAVNSRFKF